MIVIHSHYFNSIIPINQIECWILHSSNFSKLQYNSVNGICWYWDLLIHQITLVLNLYKVLICELRYYDLINFWSQRLLASRFVFFSIIAIFRQYSINACLINRILSGFNYRMVSFSNIPSLIAPWLRNLLLIWVQLVLPFETVPSIISFVSSIFFKLLSSYASASGDFNLHVLVKLVLNDSFSSVPF